MINVTKKHCVVKSTKPGFESVRKKRKMANTEIIKKIYIWRKETLTTNIVGINFYVF